MLDARLNVYAQVGDTAVTVISGETSDDFLLMSGLVTTTGRLSVVGLHPAAIGTLVKLSFVRGTVVGRMPRSRLRVLRCTVDPVRRQTDYELGDLFALKSGIRATDPLGLATPTSSTQQTYNADTLVREAMKKALGFDPGSTGISGKVWGDFDWKGGYLAGAGEVLLSFGRFAYLTPDETVAFGSLGNPSLEGPDLDLDDLIDLRPLSGGSRPGAIAIGAGQVRTVAGSGDTSGDASGSSSLQTATLNVPSVSYEVGIEQVQRNGKKEWVVKSHYEQVEQPLTYQVRTSTISSSDGTVSGSSTQTYDLVGAIGIGYMSEIPNYLYNVAISEAQRRVDALNQGIASEAEAQFPTITGSERTRELPTPTNSTLDSMRPDLVAVVPDAGPTTTVLRSIETSSEFRAADGSGGSVSRTFITRYERDLSIAQSRQQRQGTGQLEIINSSLACDFLASETRTQTSRNGALTVTRTTTWDFRSGVSTSVNWSRSGGQTQSLEPTSSTNYTTTLYRAKVGQESGSNYLDSEAVYVCPCVIVDEPKGAYATFGAVQNRLAYGYRHGLQLQSVIGVLPLTPGACVHITTDDQTGTYRVNGLSCAFDATQCLLSMDALYWGASA